jgi:hypothetical protein
MFTKLETLLLYWELEAAQWYGELFAMTTEVQLSLLLSLYKSLRSIEMVDCLETTEEAGKRKLYGCH